MATEWSTRPFGELTDNFDAVRVPVKEADRKRGPFPYYGASGIVDHVDGYLFDGEYLLIAEDGENLRTRQTPIAFLARGKFWVNNHAHIVRGNDENDTRYLMYAMRVADIAAFLTGSTMPKLTQGNMNRIPVVAPPLREQQAIAGVLGALDDKIELNQKMARELEGLARAVFKSWFVDFEPVRRAAAAQPTGLPSNVAALFPRRLVDSPIGELPEGWAAGTLGDIADVARDGVNPGDVDPSTPYIGLEHMPRRSIALTDWAHAGKVTSGKSLFRRGQILFGKLRPYFHKVGVAPVDGVCSTDIIVAEPKKPCWSALTLGHLSSDALVQHADRSSSGTKMPRTNWRDLAAFQIAMSPEPIAALASNTVAPMLDRIAAGTHQSRTLAALRDVLLPRLIYGELRIADAERIVGRAV